MGSPTRRPRLEVHPTVFWTSALGVVAILLASVLATETVDRVVNQVQAVILRELGWVYVLSMTVFLGFVVWLALGRFGRVRLGPDDARPDFGRATWFAMLFSAGMGIGLLFFGVAEPIMHFVEPLEGTPRSAEAARAAMGVTFFHWGLHAWGLYCLVAVAIGYFGFRRGLPLSIRSTLHPLLGERIHGGIGDMVDVLAVVSTLFGVATSLGLGAMQVNAGLHHVGGVPESVAVQIGIIVGITLVATWSVVSGLDVGIRRLSEANMGLATLLLLFILVTGPTAFLFGAFVENLGTYLAMLPVRSFWTGALADGAREEWLGRWTIFYWAWWIAWAPFVGMFIARISRGRTIRELVAAVLLAPTLAGFVWLTVFGDTALFEELYGAGGIAAAVEQSMPTAIFMVLERHPGAGITSVVCTACVILFFVTSSDSASLVIDTIASGGNPDPPVRQRVFWALLEGAVAAVLLLVGGLRALQTGSIVMALPFCLVVLAMMVALWRGLRIHESPTLRDPVRAPPAVTNVR